MALILPDDSFPVASNTEAAYANSLEHLRAEFSRMELLLRLAVVRTQPTDQNGGLYPAVHSGEEELFALLDQEAEFTKARGSPRMTPTVAEAQARANRMRTSIAQRSAASARQGIVLRLTLLVERFGLERLDLDMLLLALLVDLDRTAAGFVARLDPTGGAGLSVGTTMEILDLTHLSSSLEGRLGMRTRLARHAPLIRHQLVRLIGDPVRNGASLLGQIMDVDERIVAYLQGDDTLDPRLGPHVELIEPRARLEDLLLPEALKQGLARFVGPHPPTLDGPHAPNPRVTFILYFQGAAGSGKRTLAEALSGLLGKPLLAVNCPDLLAFGEDAFTAATQLAIREARLRDASVGWMGVDAILDEGRPAARTALVKALIDYDGPSFLCGNTRWEPSGTLAGRHFLRVELPRPTAAEQAQLWTRALGDDRDSDVDLAMLTSMFRLTGGQIQEAANAARTLARFRSQIQDRVTMADVMAACRLRHGKKLATLARRIAPNHGWDDLVLPADRKATLRELCLQLKHRSRVLGDWGFERKLGTGRPVAALFSGPPGTGKTMAAGVIAGELGVDLYHIDLSRVVSKYIGETEKHLAEVFADAEAANAALFFDEADALFGKRTEVRDAHDRYANIETSYLLQRIETYEGVVILASNLVKNMDDAFVRRIGLIVEFPFPNAADRLRIWEGIWPKQTPLGPDVDLGFLAERIELSGGYIRNIALAAAFLAADEGGQVDMKHLIHAARREYQKMGKMMDVGKLVYSAKVAAG